MDMSKIEHFIVQRSESESGFSRALGNWSLSDWMTATMGELGEAANVAKKLNRERDGIIGNSEGEGEDELREKLANELADTFMYLVLTAHSQGISLEYATARKFNATSYKLGLPHRFVTDNGIPLRTELLRRGG